MHRIGMLTPSSNTVLEPATSRMIAQISGVSVHFSRFRVIEIALDGDALGQFDQRPMLSAADLLADAQVSAICWNGTSASWLGIESDRRLVESIEGRTGIRAKTCILSTLEALSGLGSSCYGLVTPYTSDVQHKIVNNLSSHGLRCAAEEHFGLRDNFSFATVEPERIADAAQRVARNGAEAIVVLCTNLLGAEIAAEVERETGVPVIDSVTVTIWGALRALGLATDKLAPWGEALAALPEAGAREAVL